MESLSFIQWCLDNLNYWTITFLMMIESSFIPFPSEIVIIPAAYKAAYGELNMYLVVIFGTLGADLGAIINYYLARWIGRPLVYKFAKSREKNKFGEFHTCQSCRYGNKLTYGRYQSSDEGGYTTMFVEIAFGCFDFFLIEQTDMSDAAVGEFILFTTLGAMCWNIVLAAIGYGFHAVIPEDELISKVQMYSHEILYILITICVFIVGFLIYKGMKKSK